MLIGHFAVRLAAKKINSKPSLGTYFFARLAALLLLHGLRNFNGYLSFGLTGR